MAFALRLCAALALISALGASSSADEGAIDRAGMDLSVKAGDDFFAYANGGWAKATEIPADRSTYGAGAILSEQVDQEIADIIQRAAARPAAAGTEARKIADFYQSYMDEAAIEAKGVTPLVPLLAAIAGIADKTALARALGETLRPDIDALNNTKLATPNLFGLWVAADLDHPKRYQPFLFQGGLSMPDREYYLAETPKMAAVREKFVAHIARLLALAGQSDADAKASRIMALETAIARCHVSRADSEEVKQADNHWRRADFSRRAPGLDWDAYLTAAGLGGQRDFTVWQPGAIIGEASLVSSQTLEVWRDYLIFHAINDHAALLSKAFADADFAFYGQVMNGTPEQRPRWKRAVAATNAVLGEAVGKLYVSEHFSPQDKSAVQDIVRHLVAAFGRRIDRLDWMSAATKAKAHAKLAVLKIGIGYPDHWRRYDGLMIAKDDLFGNVERYSDFNARQKLALLGQPVARDEWVMNPHLVNAVNLPVLNALNFPAGYLRPPFYRPGAPTAVNYGAIGRTIGHEISHSFDDQGALFDEAGRLHNWWTPSDYQHFEDSAAALARQFDAYRPFDDLGVNGKQTLSENIADLGGLAAAYDAYHESLNGKEAPVIDGFTGDQQFFLSYAQGWRSKSREAALRQRLLTDGHAPPEYRALTVRNLDPWYTAFAVQPDQSLYLAPQDRVRIW